MATTAEARTQMWVGGEWVGSDGGAFDVTNPATGDVVSSVPNATVDDIRRAIDAAEAAMPAWQARPAIERARILRRAADLIRDRAGQIAGTMTDEQGKPLAEAKGEVEYA